jgi:hypothetical protein
MYVMFCSPAMQQMVCVSISGSINQASHTWTAIGQPSGRIEREVHTASSSFMID